MNSTILWDGHSYCKVTPYWMKVEVSVPRIQDDYLDCVIYLYFSASDAEKSSISTSGGSGFLVSVPSVHPSYNYVYAVTNRHVAETSRAIRINTLDGHVEIIEKGIEDWVFNDEHDIAVTQIKLRESYQCRCVPRSAFITRELAEEHRIGPGDEVFCVGRFVNHEGKQKNLPSVRFGNLSMLPNEPVYHKGSRGDVEESFLVDLRTSSGYSGSPVFLFGRNFQKDRPYWLLGIEWGYLNNHYDKINTGMSCVAPAWFLADLLDDERLAGIRRDTDKLIAEEISRKPTII